MAFVAESSQNMVEINDPLNINFERQAEILLSQLPSSGVPVELISSLEQITKSTLPPQEILIQLARLLALPALTILVARAFRPLLVDLCARFLDDETIDEVKRLEALALLLEIHEEIYPIVSSYLSRSSLYDGPLGFLLALEQSAIATLPVPTLHRLLILYYRLLYPSPFLADHFNWPLRPLTSLLHPAPHPDMGVKYLAIRCYSLHTHMCEAERIKLEEKLLGGVAVKDANIEYGEKISEGKRGIETYWVDGWVFPIIEVKRVQEYRKSLLEPTDFYSGRADSSIKITSSDLHSRITNAYGVLLFRSVSLPPSPSLLVETPSAVQAIQELGLKLSRGLPTLITSPPGAGKSFFINHLSSRLFQSQNQVVAIHLSDTSLDPRSLLGSYISSPLKPGTFKWVEGALVRAMREGKWVVLEDIDKASGEVLGTLMPLVESLGITKEIGKRAEIQVHGRPKVVAAESFALFATRSIPVNINQDELHVPSPTFLGHQHWVEVQIPAPTHSEQVLILSTKFPRLAGRVLLALLDIWEAIQGLSGSEKGRSGIQYGNTARSVGMRDVEKWINRVNALISPALFSQEDDVMTDGPSSVLTLAEVLPNTTAREEILLETYVIFAGYIPPSSTRALSSFITVLGNKLGLSEERVRWVIESRTPSLEVQKNPVNAQIEVIHIGNSKLNAHRNDAQGGSSTPARPFALHRPSLVLLQHLASCVQHQEPLLLVGETGTGKTTSIGYLAGLVGQQLVAINLSNQTETSDLLGGFKPVDVKVPASQLQSRFAELFDGTFSLRRNGPFWEEVRKSFTAGKWKRVVNMWKEGVSKAKKRFNVKEKQETDDPSETRDLAADSPRKRRKVEDNAGKPALEDWTKFERDVLNFEIQHVTSQNKFVFDFVEGPLVNAIKAGHWVLLDEINLASSETLEALAPLLQSTSSSITLTEQGSLTPVPRHPSFRLFASMNPATDVGKKDLPPNLRSRFTEIYVPPPDHDREALLAIITQYIGQVSAADKAAIMDVAEFYSEVRQLADTRVIADGSNKRPHFSMRTLARALMFTVDVASSFGLRRALWEGCLMAFTMSLDEKSASLVVPLMERWILRGVSNVSALLNQIPILPSNGQREDFVQVGPFWLLKGPGSPQEAPEYILTPSVQKKLMDLSRIILTRRFPVLIEGPTSAGKTSAIEYLAKRSGHRFVRINNHEHTDIQEYIGTYVSDPETGRLIFRDGLLVRALRNGDWIVLDELNLAPTDVLEALNRLLDDNRELFVSETQEIIRPHPSFMLFATQNPSGVYAGRKVLSRAFRNRFLDVHFGDVPQDELEIILSERTRIPRSRAKLIVSVFRELQKRRQSGRVFETKQSFATLRDLFRWAERDWKEVEEVGNRALAEAGYMLLAERTRKEDDRLVVKEVIEQILKVRIDDTKLYHLSNPQTDLRRKLGLRFEDLPGGLIWTSTLQRTFTLVFNALSHNEPVLLVGETGCGKTSACELFATMMGQKLTTVSCHQNTETADLLGGQRPVRNRGLLQNQVLSDIRTTLLTIGAIANSEGSDANTLLSLLDSTIFNKSHSPPILEQLRELRARLKSVTALFEWRDGPLVDAMRNGDVLLLDEISLADDSVLERLNSVLEPSRTLILAEKGGWDLDAVRVVASPSFKLIATMNPGGDYGKKELSPALRNRFTEIWVPQVNSRTDRLLVIESMWEHEELRRFGPLILDFCEWLAQELGEQGAVGLRDLIAWITFSNRIFGTEPSLSAEAIFHHAAHMTFIDGLRSIPQTAGHSVTEILELQSRCRHRLNELVPLEGLEGRCLSSDDKTFRIGSFGISRGPHISAPLSFNLEAPTARENALRILRASQVVKPILLEGSPGVGKTTLVSALANAAGHRLCRINLSDQTDLMDLFGSDLPVEGGKAGEFVWKDAAFLQALQDGDWVLLDEMNLAPQAVLEGLNAVLDHRGMVYIPELSRSFQRHPNFRIFAAQNPLGQGGGRKGLPKSFLNRFTKVYIQEMSPSDVLSICHQLFPQHPMESLKKMIQFNAKLYEETMMRHRFGQDGSPWEFNLRDVLRWSSLLDRTTGLEIYGHPKDHLGSVYLQRFRSATDRSHVSDLFSTIFGSSLQYDVRPIVSISPDYVQWGHHLRIRQTSPIVNRPSHVLHAHHHALEAIGSCLDQGWLVILCGPQLSGKTTLIQQLADISGVVLRTVPMNQAMDTADLLGSFEQVDVDLKLHLLRSRMRERIAKLSACMSGVNISPFRDWLLGPMVTSRAERADHLRTWMDSYGLGSDIVLRSILDEILSLAVDDQEVQTFEWVDGPLVQAVKEGQWLLLDNANLCNPSVLDRLNSLCEMNGTLALTERGLINGEVQILTPHPQFRLFMTVNPRQGELSRPMRNRGIEIVLDSMHSSGDLRVLATAARLPTGFEQRSYIKTESSYHLCRRGLSNFPESHLSVGSHVGGVVNDSVSTHAIAVLEHYSSLDPTSSFANQQACVETLLRSVIPAALNQVRRSVVYLLRDPQSTSLLASIMEKAFGYPLIELSGSLKDQVASKGISTGFLFSQPIDILLNPNLTARYEDNFRSDSTTVLNAVNLILRLQLLDSHSSSSISHGLTVLARSRQAATSVAELQRGVAELYPLMDSTEHVARAILMEMKYPQNGTSSVLYTMCKIVAYTSRLQTIASSRQFDYSSTLAVLSWFDSIDWSDRRLDEVNCRVQNLQKALRNTTGRAMRQIWSHWLKCSDIIQPNLLEKVHQLSRLAQHSQGNRHKILELIAVLGLSQTKTSEHQAQIDSMLPLLDTPQDMLGKQIRPSLADSYHLCLYEFHVLSSTAFMNFHWGQILKILIEDALRCPYYPITRLAPLQRVYWKGEIAEAWHARENLKSSLLTNWIDSLWTFYGEIEEYRWLGGSAALLQPRLLMATFDELITASVPLKDLEDCYTRILRFARFTSECAEFEAVPITLRLLNILVQQLCSFFSALESAYQPDVFSQLINSFREWTSSLDNGDPKIPAEIIPAILSISDDLMSRAASRLLCPPLERLKADSPSISDIISCYLSLAYIIIHFYLPEIPIDPSVIQRCTSDFLRGELEILDARIAVNRHAELLASGNQKSLTTALLESERDKILGQLKDDDIIGLHRKPDVERLHSLFGEISQFFNSIIGEERIRMILAGLESGAEGCISREATIQGSITGFLQRIHTTYEDLLDIVKPFSDATQVIRFALRMEAQLHLQRRSDAGGLTSCIKALVTIPQTIAASRFIAIKRSELLQATKSHVPLSEWLVLELWGLVHELRAGRDRQWCLSRIEETYEELFQLWRNEKDKESRENAESQSLYRPRKERENAAGSPEEQEEREFLQLFPQFDEGEDPTFASRPSRRTAQSYFPSSPIRDIYTAHQQIFLSQETPGGTALSLRAGGILKRLVSLLSSEAVDEASVAYRLHLLSDKIKTFEQNSTSQQSPSPDFYHDTNIREARRAVTTLEPLMARLNDLITEWPDQMILHHIRDRCEVIVGYGMDSPVAKLLAGLEQLVTQMEDWESYSNRENSLKAYQQQIASLIIDWRRLELACWSGLLESEMEAFRVHVHEWWFHLYEVVIHGTMSATQAVDSTDASVDQHIADLSQLLDQYIETSSLGEFDQRLRLLLSFYYFLDALQRPKAGRIQVAVRRVSRVVWSIHGFYAQFRPNVMSRMAQEKRVLEDQIRDFIKLASWKDINVHSLRASAQRTHHQLYKLIRKFREVLRQPVSSFFVSPVDEDSTETSLEPPSTATRSLNQDRSSFYHSPQLAFQDSQANPRFDLPRVIGRLDGVITELLEPLLVLPKAQSLEGLSVDIILTTRKFAATKIEANSPDARSKAVKALTVQKRKAWADLLKELKQAGVPQNVRPEILTHQQSRHWMLELVEPSCDGVEENLTKKANGYHYRLLSSLPRLRQSLRNHHSDVSTRDLQRGVAFVESLLNTALISRTRLSVMLENYRVLSRAIDRLRVLSTHKLGYIGFTLPRELSDVPESLFQLTSALEEAQACLLDYLLCVEKDGGVSKLTTDAQSGVRDLLSDLLQAKEEMRCMSEKILVGDVVILLEDELSLLRTSKALLLRAERVLTTLSKDPVVHRYCESIIAWLQTSRDYLRPEPDLKKPTHSDEDIISAILVIVQNLVKVAELRDEDPDQYFSCNNITLGRTTSALDLELVVQMLLRFIAGMVDSSPESFEGLQQHIGCVLPFLERYLRLVRLHLAEIGNWTKSVYKLTYVLCSTAQTLAEKGFCKPLEEGDSHENGEGTAELAEGTGLGEGSGRENVSNQIEDESQVEGLQGEDSAPKEKDDDGNQDNDAIEMADNFAGDLEDVESNAENSEDDKSDGDEAQHDEQMESLDPLDPNAVDEKLWGKESHSDDQETLENTEKNGQADENSEMAAREDEKAKRKKDNDTLQEEEEKEGTLDNDSANEDVGPDLDPNEPDLGAKMDEYPAETDALDLPDDLELDTDVKGDEDGMDVDDEDIGDSLEDAASELGQTNDDNPERDLEEGSDIAEGSERDIESSKDGEDAQDRDAAAKDDVASQPQDASRADQGTQGVKNDTKGQGNATEGHEGAEDEEAHASADNEERHPQELGDKQNEENKSFPERTSHTLEGRDGTQGTTAGTRDVDDPKSHPQVENKPIPNPIRHLGDAVKEIRRHFEEISTAAQDQEAPNQNAQSESTRLEYLQDDRSDEEMQALGPSGADDANTKLRDLKISEDEDVAPIIEDIEDTSMEPEEQTPTRQQPQMTPPSEKPINKERGDLDPAVVERRDSLSNDAVMEQDQLKDDPYEIGRKEQESTSDEELVESELRRWLHSGGGSANTTAESLWRLYEGLTHDLSFALCEQLRLILSPTLATRLKGDYKTGKRLNMKKIIPYIASEFTKDKIWLRRTKPSQREYQVLMALDDSKSMAETHSVHLAYQTLALVSKALSRLEVGEVGVAKFGQTVEMLKGFDDATNRGNLTDVEGARILGSFSFNQSATNVLELLDTSLEVLREARERRTGTASGSQRATLWQLEIIISDGICQNHEKMRALLRRAEEQKVMIVFVILDSLHRQPTALPSSSQTSLTPASSSILSMNQVEYKKNLVTGKMEMTMGRYLDTFPFEYYIVLRDVEALPDVLARTLREFFEKTVEE